MHLRAARSPLTPNPRDISSESRPTFRPTKSARSVPVPSTRGDSSIRKLYRFADLFVARQKCPPSRFASQTGIASPNKATEGGGGIVPGGRSLVTFFFFLLSLAFLRSLPPPSPPPDSSRQSTCELTEVKSISALRFARAPRGIPAGGGEGEGE